ncbi:hypothetical protein DIPPA_19523 [Diplonema papillatum]|nr:hypothetical protein DIPPA_19523 [Diplonema papillatum]
MLQQYNNPHAFFNFRGVPNMMPPQPMGFMPPHAAHHQAAHHAAHHHMALQNSQTQPPMPAPQTPFMKRPTGQMQPNMPPSSNYTAPADNPEYTTLPPGEAKTLKGYGTRPITEKGKTLMETYERVMARPQGTFPQFGAKDKKDCHFFNSPAGCRNGDACAFGHVPGSSPPTHSNNNSSSNSASKSRKMKCRNFPNCKFGNKCRFLHGH